MQGSHNCQRLRQEWQALLHNQHAQSKAGETVSVWPFCRYRVRMVERVRQATPARAPITGSPYDRLPAPAAGWRHVPHDLVQLAPLALRGLEGRVAVRVLASPVKQTEISPGTSGEAEWAHE